MVLVLTPDSDLAKVKVNLQEGLSLSGGVLITLPNDRLYDEVEQLVHSTTQLPRILDDFCMRQHTRRMFKVILATLPITRCLVDGACIAEGEDAMVLALNQLSELAQLRGNLETLERAGLLMPLIAGVNHVIQTEGSIAAVAVACTTVWILATSGGLRQHLMQTHLLKNLLSLLENIAIAVETPGYRKRKGKAGEESAVAVEGTSVDSGNKSEPPGSGDPHAAEVDRLDSTSQSPGRLGKLEPGPELDELARNCLGAISAVLHSEEAKESLSQPRSRGLSVLLELATVAQGRNGIGDERVPCMAAEALTLVLNSHGGCRIEWCRQGNVLSLLDLIRSPFPRVVLCGTSTLNGLLRGKPPQILISAFEAWRILEQTAAVCQRCLDRLETTCMPGSRNEAENGFQNGTSSNQSLPPSADCDASECFATLEQATAACWGSLAVVDRSLPDPADKPISVLCWLPSMLRVARITANKPMSRWVSYCAVAAIGFCVGGGTKAGKDVIAEVITLPLAMLDMLKSRNSMKLQEHSARALCNMLASNECVRQKALEDGFLDKLQRILMRRIGSTKLDMNVACSIMHLCHCDTINEGGGNAGLGLEGWGKKQLNLLLWALGHKNEHVLRYTAWTIWLLARRPEYRAWLGQMWAIDGLLDGLRSNARLELKEAPLFIVNVKNLVFLSADGRCKFVAAAWLLACHPDNIVRLAMKGGLHLLVGMLHFPSEGCYVPLKTLAVGALCQLCSTEPDVAMLAMHLNLAPALLRAASSDASTDYLKVLSAGLVFSLCRNTEHADNRSDYLKQFAAESGKFFLEEMCVAMLCSGISELQACGAFCAASLSLEARSRQCLLYNGGVKALCLLAKTASTSKGLRLRVIHALLNISTEPDCQSAICKWALQCLVDITTSGAPTQAEFASSVLLNCMDNPSCRSIMFQEQVALGSTAVVHIRAARGLATSIPSWLWANQCKGRNRSNRTACEQFSAWVQDIKGELPKLSVRNQLGMSPQYSPLGRNALDCAGEDDRQAKQKPNVGNNKGKDKTRTYRRRDQDTFERFSNGGGGGCQQQPFRTGTAQIRDDDLTPIRQNMRRSVSSLWQPEAQRASTAPAKVLCGEGGSNDILREGSHRRTRPHSQVRTANAIGDKMPSSDRANTKERGGGDVCGVVRGDNVSASAYRVSGLDRPAGILTDSGYNAEVVSEHGSTEETVDGSSGARATPVTLRSSHRVGPVGALGSTSHPSGEYRWKPFVADCYTKLNSLPTWRQQQNLTATVSKGTEQPRRATPATTRKSLTREVTKEARETMFDQAVKERQTVVIVEPPLNYRMTFDGPTNMDLARSSVKFTSMALFPHPPGASVCAPLYEHYVAEDGLCYHLYHTGRVVCEVLDPGGYPSLCAPIELRHVLRTHLPKPPPPDYPSGAKNAKPILYLPPERECPRPTTHYIPLCEVACRQAHEDERCPGAKCEMTGAMPTDFLLFEVGEEPAEESVDDEENVAPDSQNKWTINNSIFAPRRKEADSRSFLDTERVVKKSFDVDYGRMLKEGRVLRLMAKADAAVGRGEKSVDDSLEEVKAVIAPFYKVLLHVFNFYCLTPSQSIRGAFSIQPNQFSKMMQDADLAGNSISVEEIGKIFVMVNFETNKGTVEADVNEDRALMRFEFIEALLRVAITMRDNEGEEEISPAEKLRAVISDRFLANLPSEATEDSDTFRDQTLYTEACDRVFQEHQKALAIIYQKYSLLDPIAGKPSFGLEEWKVFLMDARLIGDNGHVLRLALRDSKLPFYRARMMCSDEIKNRTKMMQLTFVDFLEALAWLAGLVPMPSDEDMKMANVTDILDYEAAFAISSEGLNIQQGMVKSMTERPIATRLDQLIRLIVGTLAIRSNGSLKAGNHTGIMNVVGLYCTKEQLARGVLQ